MDQWIVASIAVLVFGAFALGYGLGRKERNNIREQFQRDLEAFVDDTEHRVGLTK